MKSVLSIPPLLQMIKFINDRRASGFEKRSARSARPMRTSLVKSFDRGGGVSLLSRNNKTRNIKLRGIKSLSNMKISLCRRKIR